MLDSVSGVIGGAVVLVVLALSVWSFGAGREQVAKDCDKLGATAINGVVYECRKR